MKIERTELVAFIVLFVGVILLAFTFFSAYGFLSGELSILASTDLSELFGRAMAPLIEAIIRILYLGIMGWIGSILTIRGIQLLKREKETYAPQSKVNPETKQSASPAPMKVEPRPDVKEPKKPENSEKASLTEHPKESEKENQAK